MATDSAFDTFLDRLARTALFYSPLRHFSLYRYRYAFSPAQLCALVALVDEARQVSGDFAEVGCYRGYTTAFLNRHLDEVCPDRRYLVIDTFGGFTSSSVATEVAARGKRADDRAFRKFTVNSRRVFAATMRLNGIRRVDIIAGDVAAVALLPEHRFCFGLVDVDLYAPSVAALNLLWSRLTPGGLLVVDDCQADHVYDGSRQALEEFARARGVPFEIRAGKLGILRKPIAS